MGQLLKGPARRISLLLMFVWFANALNYYGLVLLTTTVTPTWAHERAATPGASAVLPPASASHARVAALPACCVVNTWEDLTKSV